MKLRTWLATVFLVVMLLPLGAAYLMYVFVSQLDTERAIPDYIELTDKISSIEDTLQEPALYHFHGKDNLPAILERYKKRQSVRITLYNSVGAVVYNNTDSGIPEFYSSLPRNQLYQNLYEYDMGYKTVSMKKPVFSGETIVGFYEIAVLREKLAEGVQNRSLWTVGLFGLIFVLIYIVALWLLNQRFNRPLNRLMAQMSAFAEGKRKGELSYKRNDEIGRLIGNFKTMKHTIEETQGKLDSEQQEKEMMIASLSHDLKTPLTSIRAYSEALSNPEGLSERERQEYQHIMMTKTDYIKQMIEDITAFTLLQSHSYEMEKVEVDGDELFDTLTSGYLEPCRQEGITLIRETLIEGPCQVNVKMMTRLIDNLVGNAIRYTFAGGHLWLGVYDSQQPLPDWLFASFREEAEQFRDDHMVIMVQNEGQAMTAEQQNNAFQPFYQGAQSRAKGTGLGLSIARMVAEKHDGEIEVWSKEGHGTLIMCRFGEQVMKDDGNET